MIEAETKVKKWGNSLGVVLPRDLTRNEKVKAGDKIKIIVIKEQNTLKDVFGSLKNWKVDSQKLKDDLRKEWSKR